MAAIVELSYPDSVTLIRGAVQNWRDLAYSLPSRSPAVQALLGEERVGSALLVGPHDEDLVTALAALTDELTIVTRAVLDASDMAAAAPAARVLAGDVMDAELAAYDLVVSLTDLALVQSPERPTRRWVDIADRLAGLVAPGGRLILAIENERGEHRLRDGIDPYVADRDRDWTPFATWDATRPRTLAQVDAWRETLYGPTQTAALLPTWQHPSVVALGAEDPAVLRFGAAAAAIDPAGSVLAQRSAGLADRVGDAAAGWVVRAGRELPREVISAAGLHPQRWTIADSRARADRQDLPAPATGTTFLVPVIEAIIDRDTARLRELLHRWAKEVRATCVGGVVPAALADVRLGNLIADGDRLVPVHPGVFGQLPDEALWDGLADLMRVVVEQGLPHPWPTAMLADTRLATLGAMIDLTPPDDLVDLVPIPEDQGQTRADLLAVIKRQQAELRSAWARFRWDEREYATYKLGKAAKSRVRKAVSKGKRLTRRSAGSPPSSVDSPASSDGLPPPGTTQEESGEPHAGGAGGRSSG